MQQIQELHCTDFFHRSAFRYISHKPHKYAAYQKINLRVHTLGIHIHTKRYNIHITGTLTISEQSSLNSVSTCKKTHLGVCNATSTIIVRMKRNDHVFTVFQIITHVFHLTCIHMRHRMLNRNRQVDDRFVICSGLPYIQNRIAHLQCIRRLCSRKALRAVLKLKIAFCLISQLFRSAAPSTAIFRISSFDF